MFSLDQRENLSLDHKSLEPFSMHLNYHFKSKLDRTAVSWKIPKSVNLCSEYIMKIKFSMEKCDSWKIIREKLVFLSSGFRDL